jgi:hypothetical protein
MLALGVRMQKNCSICGVPGHNAATCEGKDTHQVADPPDKDAPLDVLIDLLLRARGYRSLARVLAIETTPEAWSTRLYDLADLTDCEDVCTLASYAFLDAAHMPRLVKVTVKQRSRDDLLDTNQSMFILDAIASLGKKETKVRP